ncbi:endonuclease domain-containing protein [Actinomadura sp. 21ATH]|uniref:endonuclease domain-containing protein n=1 Tax=Actinomadura sp. 21ATH TaxID=1735444 RepID=UPI0035C1F8E3
MGTGAQDPVRYNREQFRKLGRPQEPCEVCGGVDHPRVRDHCHSHGWIRGILCNYCNGLMQSIDRGAFPGRHTRNAEDWMYVQHWLRCPDCRAAGWSETARCKCDHSEPVLSRYNCTEPPSCPPCPWVGTGFRPER